MKCFWLSLLILGAVVEFKNAAAADNCQKILCKAPCRVIRNSNNCPVCQCNGPNGNCQFVCPTSCRLINTNDPNCPYSCSCL
ncbi:uncharacterized protein TNIN_481992 [Trichonephila inaurata madagascariensis]|uniref:Uncharacterized protein n=1 Tax=Trichonephila inaurata madagascariensis TaxID=2747483 RepID=A0A8X6K4P0_9ARAC|nr:uncharacterized protein TNIN_481992 [Trichonephila inaurata madagascariensis]